MRITASLFAITLALTPTLALAQAAPTRAELARIDRILRRTPVEVGISTTMSSVAGLSPASALSAGSTGK